MGFNSMVQQIARVVAFAAIACLSLQVACTIGVPQLTSAPSEAHGNSGCHESAPSTPPAPGSSHICCSGDHSPDALLSAPVAPAPLVLDGSILGLIVTLRSFTLSFADFFISFSPPRGPLALRI